MRLIVHGQEAYAYTGGKPFDASLPTVVLIHGAMGDHSIWTLLARWFANHGRSVLAVDLPGHMRSAGPALASVDAMADWVLALMTAAGVHRAALAGHSLGSLVALEAAARAPERATTLLMLGTCVPMPVPQALLDLGKQDVHAAIDRVVKFSISTLGAKPSYPGPGAWLHGGARALMRQVASHSSDPMLFHTDFSACNDYRNGMNAAAKVACAAHLVLAEQDQMTLPRNAREVAAVLKADIHRVPGGHFLMHEQPDLVLHAMRKALE
ncbi:MAG: alpha/beta fold hydrolase [Aquincola sp.]|nr:alpha/beta fold hydrolase [Aquincola sp.]MDH5328798.1 alpha/beta fold hydrolase [Aquincola sp.]